MLRLLVMSIIILSCWRVGRASRCFEGRFLWLSYFVSVFFVFLGGVVGCYHVLVISYHLLVFICCRIERFIY